MNIFVYFSGTIIKKETLLLVFKEIYNYNIFWVKRRAAVFRNVSDIFGMEIVNYLNLAGNMLVERFALNFIAMKFKWLLARKRWEGDFYLIELCFFMWPLFLNVLFRCYILVLWPISGKCSLLLWQIYGNFLYYCSMIQTSTCLSKYSLNPNTQNVSASVRGYYTRLVRYIIQSNEQWIEGLAQYVR